jgi:protein-tyrosine phosphatase
MLEYYPGFTGGAAPDVPDPWYGSMDGFERVYQMIDAACGVLADRLVAQAGS